MLLCIILKYDFNIQNKVVFDENLLLKYVSNLHMNYSEEMLYLEVIKNLINRQANYMFSDV